MLLTEERNSQRIETVCICGKKAELQHGTRYFTIRNKEIALKNVPHFYCSYCEKASYDSSVNVDELLIYAYKNALDEVDWNKRESCI